MPRENVSFPGIIGICLLTGCVELSATGRVAQVGPNSDARFAEAERFHVETSAAGSSVAATDDQLPNVQNLKPGQQVRIAACVSSPEELAQGSSLDVTQYAGTVESIDETRVILSNASVLTEHATGVPVVRRVPYLSRLYKNSGPSVVAEPLPHGVVLLRRQLVSVQPNMDVPYERIGVDFELTRQ
jgi:hypothetical protein